MPPRKAAGAPAKRATRATARKSTAKSLAARDPSESLPTNPPEITVPAPEPSSERVPGIAPKIQAEIAAPAATDGTLGETAAPPPETTAVEASAPTIEEPSQETTVGGTEGSGAVPENVEKSGVSPPLPGTAPIGGSVPEHVEKDSGEKAVDGTGGIGAEIAVVPPRKTVVKKKVRIVKKVVKKLVPKRVEKKSLVNCSNKESEKAEIAGDGEKSKAAVLGSMEVINPNPSVTNSMEIESSKPSVSVAMEVENPNPSVAVSMEVENSDPGVAISLEIEQSDKSEVCGGKTEVTSTGVVSEARISDSVGDKKCGGVIEKSDSNNGVLVEALNADSVGGGKGENVTDNVDSSGGGDAGEKEEVGNCDVGGSKGEVELGDGLVVLSEEMEALERQRRRRTEIFLGGLDKSATEEDIRKVFEEVGQVLEVRLMMNSHTGKNKGYAFLRYALAADAKKALEKYPKVEICGKQCGTAPVEGNDTIFLGNIDKKWKNEDVVKLLQEIGIEKIDKVTVMADPNNVACNRGFAFLELETNRDAQNAYKKLQKKDVFGKHHNIKVAWAEPLNEPDEEEMLKVKSVYAEFIPSSWDEVKVRDYFKKFGEVDNVVLARNLRSSKRKDFAFVHFTTREAALACIDSFSHELLNDEASKVNVKVSLAKPIPKVKQNKRVSNPISKESFKEKPKVSQRGIKPNEPRNKGKLTRSNYEDRKGDRRISNNSELLQPSRGQTSWRQSQIGLGIGSVNLDYPYSLPGRKRPYSALVEDPLYSDLRAYPRPRLDSSYPVASPSYNALSQGGVGMTSLPYYQRQGAGYTSGSPYGITDHSGIQREGASYRGSSGLYYRY
ncbi:hypothetical protein L1049_007973 [Liquidambar formosana]|uniref:RRM domain-containing protein n=1 Tax=Liquidambar formosana TaxID=63359 RepID=A0AAP0S5Q5_LIQFO